MSVGLVTTALERTNLEAHVDLCAERYRVLEEKVNNIDRRLDAMAENMYAFRDETKQSIAEMREENIKSNAAANRIIITAAATVVAGVLSTLVVLVMS
jgi:DNA-binding ferritin-like protein|tara:strand:+ start:552 stop:845 length:294 start_codon:yes stop_codon:yes gene_type:complete